MQRSNARHATIRRGFLGWSAGLVVGASGAGAWGQAASADAQSAPLPALSGPRIDQPITAADQNFVPTEREREARARLSARMLPTILREMGSRRAPEGVRLSPQQLQQIEALRTTHDDEVNAFIQTRKPEIVANLRGLGLEEFASRIESLERVGAEQVRGMVERGPRAAMMQLVGPEKLARVESGELDRRTLLYSLTPDQRTALESLNSLRQGIPGEDGFSAKMLGVLNDQQRAFVEERLTQVMGRMQRDARATGRAAPGTLAGAPADAIGEGAPGGAMGGEMSGEVGDPADQPARLRARGTPDRLDRLLQRLTPEQREMLADMIERRMLDGRRGGDALGREKSPPSMEEIDLPPPGP